MIKSKKGIEPVIATVLLIVISIAVVGVVVAFLMPYIQSMTDKQTACKDVRLEIDQSNTCYNSSGTFVMVSYASGETLSKIIIQASSSGTTDTNTIVGSSLPQVGGADTYVVASITSATKAGAIPYVKFKNKEFMCENGKTELSPIPLC